MRRNRTSNRLVDNALSSWRQVQLSRTGVKYGRQRNSHTKRRVLRRLLLLANVDSCDAGRRTAEMPVVKVRVRVVFAE